MHNRPLFRKKELVPLLAILLLLAGLWLWRSFAPQAGEAVIEVDNKITQRIPLGEPRTLTVDGKLTLVFDGTGVYVESAACRDKVCQRTGKITKSGEAIVCLPAGISVRLTGGEGYDAVAY